MLHRYLSVFIMFLHESNCVFASLICICFCMVDLMFVDMLYH